MNAKKLLSSASAALLMVGILVVFSPGADAAPTSILSTMRMTVASSFAPPSPFTGSAEYDPTNISDVGGWATTSEVSINVAGGTAGRNIYLDLVAPEGDPFHVGSYLGDGGTATSGKSSFNEGDQGCQAVPFTILDLATSGKSITRLDVRFETTCTFNPIADATISGELLLGEPLPAAGLMTATRQFSWPTVPVGRTSGAALPLPFRNVGNKTMHLGVPSVTGASAKDFAVVSDSCVRAVLLPHQSCSLTVTFAPHAAGTRTAAVAVRADSGVVTIPLRGTSPVGHTMLRASSTPGEYVGAGQSYLITDMQSPMIAQRQGRTGFLATTANGRYDWMVQVMAPRGANAITLGTHDTSPTNSSNYSLVVTGQGRGCDDDGSVTVKQVTFDVNHDIAAFDMTFTQPCGYGTGGKLTGEVAYRATVPSVLPTAPFILHTGQSLTAGHTLTNSDEGPTRYQVTVTAAGQVRLITRSGRVLWSTPAAASRPGDRLTVLPSGRVALVSAAGAILWSTPAVGAGSNYFLTMQTDGNLVLYSINDAPVWATHTAQPPV